MKKLSNYWLYILGACLTLGLAPFQSPHIVGKIRWLLGGNAFSSESGMKLMDWFDLVLHGTPWFLLLLAGCGKLLIALGKD
ncbi:conserved hypothetical protein [Tenacibaculum litopenaei]|jgi:hypothetical protein|uniref:hypothetical protein n=1 Tax=Tenacibaculum litopenaei TaxID=396016 RepID=UPI0038936B1B